MVEGDGVSGASIVAGAKRASLDGRSKRLVGFAAAAAIALLAAQAFVAARLELTFDEAYYTLWSRSLALGYFDHPPMAAAVIRASTSVFGDGEFGVRALALFLVGALPALIAAIAWRLFDSVETAALAVVVWIATPLVQAGAAFVTPDAPLVIFWTLGLAALVELWRTQNPRWLLAAGLALGLMLQSKFTGAFFAAGAALALLTAPSMRRWLVSPVSALGLLVALAVFAPFLAWNAAHGWATFLKQGGRAAAESFAPLYVVEFLAAQIGLMNPAVFAAFAAALAAISWRGNALPGSKDEARRLLASTILPAALYFLVHALHDRVQGNWLAPLYPASAILAADWLATAGRGSPAPFARVLFRALPWAAAAALAAMALAFVQAQSGLLPLGSLDPTARIGGFRELARELDARAAAAGAPYVLTQGYALTSLMTYYGDPSVAVVQPEQRIRWIFAPAPAESLFASPGLALGESGKRFDLILKMRFRAVELAGTLTRARGGRAVETYELYRVADPYGPALDRVCPSGEVDLSRRCRP